MPLHLFRDPLAVGVSGHNLLQPGIKLPVKLTAFVDKTYDYVRFHCLQGCRCAIHHRYRRPVLITLCPVQRIRLPPVSFFLLEAAGAKDGANKPGDETIGTVSLKHVYEIARVRPSCFLVCVLLVSATVPNRVSNKPDLCLEATRCPPLVLSAAIFLQLKCEENRDLSMRAWCTQIIGSAHSMGIRVVAKPQDAM